MRRATNWREADLRSLLGRQIRIFGEADHFTPIVEGTVLSYCTDPSVVVRDAQGWTALYSLAGALQVVDFENLVVSKRRWWRFGR